MKKIFIPVFALVALTFMSALALLSAQADNDKVTVTWNSGEAAYMIGNSGKCSEVTASFSVGHVITEEDLPNVYSYAKTSDKYHSEWEGAVGTAVTEDTQFNLVWKSNYEGYKTVIWKSSVLPDCCVMHVTDRECGLSDFFCEIEIFPDGHVIDENDIAAHSHYENDTGAVPYHYEWTGAKGTAVTENDTFFLYECIANNADSITVTWYNFYYGIGIFPKNSDFQGIIFPPYAYSTVFKRGHSLTEDDLPAIHNEDEYLYYYTWEDAEGTVLTENTYFQTVQHHIASARIKMYLDSELVYDEVLNTGTRITMPEVIEGHEEMHIWSWVGESKVGQIECDVGEVFEVNFDVVFDAKCILWGDITHDNNVNTHDAVVVLKRIAQDKPFRVLEKMAADMDKNDVVNTRDAVLILKLVASK